MPVTVTKNAADTATAWFAALRDDQADETVWIAFGEWLEADPSHPVAYADVERLWSLMDEARASEAANTDTPLTPAERARRPSNRFAIYSAMAAAVTGAIGLGVWLQSAPSAVVYRTDDAPREVTLADGSILALNRQTEVSVDLKGDTRRVSLDHGEAAFDVAHDADHPFVVTAGSRRVEVLGTAFDIVSHDGDFRIDVSRGVVAVTPAGGFQRVRLPAGQALSQNDADRPVTETVDPQHTDGWRRGVLVYRGDDLRTVAGDLSRYFDKTVTVSPSVADLTFTGTLRIDDEATMLRQLEDFVPVRVERGASEIRLTKRDGR